MPTINPYLTFDGTCEEAFGFYKKVFDSEFQFIGRYKDVPAADRQNFPLENDEKIMHVSLPISQETILMGCDSTEAFGKTIKVGNNISLSVNAETKGKADEIFNALSSGGQIQMPMNETFWGSYFGVLTDKFGIQWMISTESKDK